MQSLSDQQAEAVLREEQQRRVESLHAVPLFSNLDVDDEFFVALADKLSVRTERRHAVVVEKDTVGDEMYFVNRGEAEVLHTLEPDAPPFATVEVGGFFGEGALLGGEGAVRNAYVRARKGLQLHVLAKADLEVLLH